MFGTGRVISQTTMHAVFFPRANSASGFVPVGLTERGFEHARGVGEWIGRADRQRRSDQPIVRKSDIEPSLAVVERDFHEECMLSR